MSKKQFQKAKTQKTLQKTGCGGNTGYKVFCRVQRDKERYSAADKNVNIADILRFLTISE